MTEPTPSAAESPIVPTPSASQLPPSAQQPYAQQPSPPQVYPARPRRGALPFGLAFIGLVFLPFVSLLATGIVMAIVGASQRKYGGLAALNGRRAANWGLTMIVILVPMMALWITALSIQASGFFPWGISIIVWVALGVANLIVGIYGLVMATSDREARVPAIPFLR